MNDFAKNIFTNGLDYIKIMKIVVYLYENFYFMALLCQCFTI